MSELIDREALKDAVKRYAGEPIKKKDRKCQSICLDMLGTIDAQPTASPWHRVEEELPKVGTNCLVGWKLNDGFFYEDSVYGYGTNGLGFWVRREEHDQVVDPDYWMPIEPPKEDA